MAAKLSGPGGGSKYTVEQNNEINVTPFVDVILVLLIIFMVAAPLATVDVPVDLPSNAATASPPPIEPVYVSVQADGALFVQEQAVTLQQLAAVTHGMTAGNLDTRLFLRGDQAVDYGSLMRVMNTLQKAGYARISLVASEELEP